MAIQAWLIKPYQIPSGSMEPTLDIGQRVLVNRFIYHFEDPSIGDIIVFHPPEGVDEEAGGECGEQPPSGKACDRPTQSESGENFIKRLVAGPGDSIQIIHGIAIVNGKVNQAANGHIQKWGCGKPLARVEWKDAPKESVNAGDCNFPTPITIPPGHYFMMGDNRDDSKDSRYWGPIPRSWIIGKAFATYWPPDRIGLL